MNRDLVQWTSAGRQRQVGSNRNRTKNQPNGMPTEAAVPLMRIRPVERPNAPAR